MTTVNQAITGATDSNGFSLTLTATGTLAADGSGTLTLRSTLNSTVNNFSNYTINSSIIETAFSVPNFTVANNSVQRTLAKNSSLLVAQGSFSVPARTTSISLRFVADSDGVGTASYIPNATRAVLTFTLAAPIQAPSAPTSLSATTNRTDGVNLTWSGASGSISGYDIWWNTTPQGSPSSTSAPDFQTSSTSYLDTGIGIGQTRYYWVRARGTGGNSAWFPSGNGITGTRLGAPSQPSGLFTFGVTQNAASLGWSAVSGATLYTVYLNGSPVTNLSSSTTSYQFTGLAGGTQYTLGVSARNDAGDSAISTASITTGQYTYTIAYNANGGTGSMSSTTTTSGSTSAQLQISANSFQRSGFSFNGWNTNSSGTGTSYSSGQFITLTSSNPSITLFAQWLAALPVFTETFITPTGILGKNISLNADRTVTASPVQSYSIIYSGSGLNPTSWLTINSSGQLSGMPPAVGIYTFTIRANNGGSNNTDFGPISLTIRPAGRRFNGSNFGEPVFARRFDGANWIDLTVMKKWDGSSWVNITN